jgi:hypothetical protein
MAKTVTEIFEEVKTEMCDKYCRFPREYDPEEHDDVELWETDICKNCPLGRL